MTLTELKYLIAVAKERHFGRAAEASFVSQPTLSVAIKKLEDELGVTLFERGGSEVSLTGIGTRIVEQAQKILAQSTLLKEIARQGQNPLFGPLKLGIIHTVGPYLLPYLVPAQLKQHPEMPLILQENFTARLIELLRQGDLDCAIMADPIDDPSFEVVPLYDEEFIVAVPSTHEWVNRKSISTTELKSEHMLLLGTGHCFRDQVLQVCPEMSRYSSSSGKMQKMFEGSSLETIRHMVAAGLGITLLPKSAVPNNRDVLDNGLVKFIKLKSPVPSRRIVIVWRRSFPRKEAIEVLINTIQSSQVPGVTMFKTHSIVCDS